MAGIIGRSSCSFFRKTVKPNQLCQLKKLSSIVSAKQLAPLQRVMPVACKIQQNVACKRWMSGESTESLDEASSRVLSELIASEQQSLSERKDVKTVVGWNTEVKGNDVKLSGNYKNEKIIVKFNILNSMESAMSEEDKPSSMECNPPFSVEIHKKNGKIMNLQCVFPDEYDEEIQDEEPQDSMADKFQIVEVSLHDKEVSDSAYSSNGDTMDPEIYEILMDMLEERGIGDEFIENLVTFATSYEQKQYIKFLEDFKTFVDTK